ncbi:carbon storage regulator CsrA [Dethiosulfovibrio salsuginis]|uniref:Translational regulator CsrA n=1 Tax=Dethiosulfovibrio salsuginis TaxID=561720 RepID=A0A1X7ITW3_9BACT|nr:carbon storage regulator CsrA [Dethiosulfovibrio salsuginis]SMG18633.1 carbon storage regulator, CsrA [Dethiosulfovibrio salsuginis]
MLVLSRKPGESLLIGQEMEITVVEVKGDSVRLAIKAPRDVPVWRKEVMDDIKAANLKAGGYTKDSMTIKALGDALGKKNKKDETKQEASHD